MQTDNAGIDWAFWPDQEALECAILRPQTFALPKGGRIDTRWFDLAEWCEHADGPQQLLELVRARLGEEHPTYRDIAAAWWSYNDRQNAKMGSKIPDVDPREDAFLQSFEWRRVRMMVLERDGGRCNLCGRTAADKVKINVDHIQSRKRHPELALDPNNLQVLCGPCNHGKGNRYSTDWRRPETRA